MDHREYFNQLAPEWDDNKLNRDNLKPLFDRLRFNAEEKIIDCGTGTGNLIPFLKNKVDGRTTIIGVDFARKMTKRAEERFKLDNVYFITADVLNMPFGGDCFTTVLHFSIFPHVLDKQKAIFEARRVLRTGGRLIISHLMSRQKLNEFHSGLNAVVMHDRLPDSKEMTALLNNAEFRNIDLIDENSFYFVQAFK